MFGLNQFYFNHRSLLNSQITIKLPTMLYYSILLFVATTSADILKTKEPDNLHRVTIHRSVHQPLARHQINVHPQPSHTSSNVKHQQRTLTLVHPQTVHQPSVHQTQETFTHHDLVHQNVNHADHEETVDIIARHGPRSENTVATARIIQHDAEVNPDGSFFNVWNSDNGINVQEQGTVKHVGDVDVIVSNGEISYTDDEGHTYHLRYVADENGFRPEGDHLPTPPPIPEAIARGLEYIAAHPYVEEVGGHQNTDDSPVVIDN